MSSGVLDYLVSICYTIYILLSLSRTNYNQKRLPETHITVVTGISVAFFIYTSGITILLIYAVMKVFTRYKNLCKYLNILK